jgi:hypothetical protein
LRSSISEAIAKFKIHRGFFYNNITATQKQELLAAKALHTIYGQGSSFGDWNTKTKNKLMLLESNVTNKCGLIKTNLL